LNARTMLGAAPDMAVSCGLGACAFAAVLGPVDAARERRWQPALWVLAAGLLLALAIGTRGALLSALPPLGAAAAASWLAPPGRSGLRRVCGYALAAMFLLGAALVMRDVHRDATEHSVWLGGAAASINPPTFDFVLEQVFHAFAPWSVLLPLALSRITFAADATRSRSRLALLQGCMLWAALSYGAQTLFMSRYGQQTTYLAVVPLALLVATLIRDLEQ